jgi:hypothetical protein
LIDEVVIGCGVLFFVSFFSWVCCFILFPDSTFCFVCLLQDKVKTKRERERERGENTEKTMNQGKGGMKKSF